MQRMLLISCCLVCATLLNINYNVDTNQTFIGRAASWTNIKCEICCEKCKKRV